MRNYYAALETTRDSAMPKLLSKLQQLGTLEPAIAEKAEKVLLIEHRKAVYDNVHLQYEAIGLAFQAFKSEIEDTNDWNRRLVEFITPEAQNGQ